MTYSASLHNNYYFLESYSSYNYVKSTCDGMAFRDSGLFHFLFLSLTIFWFACGIYVFTSGFLLSRSEINLKSTCQTDDHSSEKSSTCWTVPSIDGAHKKVVVIIIDALRYDFAFYQDHSTTDLPYINKLKIFRELATEHGCSHARLFKFRADAPTTTMQRIKGMTTGSFPTFIDVSNNFDSTEISEDNLIDQILKTNKENITFLGDDTWIKLFPGRFANAYPFPSFDVKDLHLVDNGILKHLKPELLKSNWKMLIAHFLGVDHCGHRYGPMHSEMSSKLDQMNSVLRDVVDTLDSDTLLLVMGDHGMTQTGDHGGETVDEIDSALFAFSRKGIFSQTNSINTRNCASGTVHQIDIVPTLSLLLGTPIPFSNLGAVIGDFIPDNPPSNLREALLTNARQIKSYLKEYSRRYNEFSAVQFHQLMDQFEAVEQKNTSEILQLLYTARDLCKSIWAHFDEKSMVFGACLITSICVVLLDLQYKMYFLGLTTAGYCATYVFVATEYQFMIFGFALLILLLHIIFYGWKGKLSVVEMLCPVLLPWIYFSNSYVNNEDIIIMYLYSSAFIVLSLRVVQRTYTYDTKKHITKTKKSNRSVSKLSQIFYSFTKPFGIFTLLVVALMLIVRLVFLFRICRPEQHWCLADLNQPSSNSAETAHSSGAHYLDELLNLSNSWSRLLISGGSLVGILICVKQKLQSEGNLRSPYSAAVVCTNKLLPLAVLFIIGNWQLQTTSAEELDSLPSYFITFLPRCAYAVLFLSFIWWLIHPLTVHLLYRDKYGQFRDEFTLTDNEVVSFYFKKLSQQADDVKQRKRNGSNGNETFVPDFGQPAAFGLYTLFSSAIIGLGTVLIFFGAMLLEERYAPVLLEFVISTGILLEILSAIYHRQGCTSCDVSWEVVGIWVLSCSYWWFATGHQASLSSIPWNAAFVGFQGSHPTVALPAVMVGANIFISQVLHTVFLPLLLLWPVRRGSWFSKTVPAKKSDVASATSTRISEFELIQSASFWKSFTQLLCRHIFMHALKVLGSVCAAFMHRRHLMVWQIFAPRFVYEVLGFSVVCVTSLFIFIFAALFKRSLNSWIRKENL